MSEASKWHTDQSKEITQKYTDRLHRKLTYTRIIVTFFAAGAVLVILPLAMAALTAGLALVAAGVLAVLSFMSWKMLPRLMLRVENRERERTEAEMNRSLAALKAEAARNPIEQAERAYLRRSEQYEAFKTALEQIGARVQGFRAGLARIKKEKPGYDLAEETEALGRMEAFYASRMEGLALAVIKLGEFRDKIDEARTKWRFQLDANAAIHAMNATDQHARLNEILTEVSFDTVHHEFEAVFARLDSDAAEIRGKKALEFGRGKSIDIAASAERQRAATVASQTTPQV